MRMRYLDPRLRCRLISVLAITANQVVGGAIVLERGFGRTFEFRNDALRQDLAQLDAPLIERIDVPDDTLRENRVLPVSPGLAPVNRCGIGVDWLTLKGDALSVTLHGQLLEICRETFQVLLVRENGDGLRAEKVVVPEGEQAHEHGQVGFERRGAKVFVHLVEAIEHGAEIIRADGNHGGKTDGRTHGVTAADPIPELEHIGSIDAELGNLSGIGRYSNEMLSDRLRIAPEPC